MTRSIPSISLLLPALAVICSAQTIYPLNPSVEPRELGRVPRGWSVLAQWPAGVAYTPSVDTLTGFARLVDTGCRTRHCTMLTGSPEARSMPAGNLLQVVPAEAYRLRRIRLSASMRVEGADTELRMWLRLERADGSALSIDSGGKKVAAPILPLRPGLPERQTHDYKRHGTTTLFNILNGKAIGTCQARHHSKEFVRFPNQLEMLLRRL